MDRKDKVQVALKGYTHMSLQ